MVSIREVYILEAQRNEIKFRKAARVSAVVLARKFGYQCTVQSTDIKIRQLTAADAFAYRECRLEALRSSPEAFGSTYEQEYPQTLDWFAARLRSADMFGAFRDADLLGIAGLLVSKGHKEVHKGLLVSMYVRPAARKMGLGRQLVETIIEFARERVEVIQLSVVSENEGAIRLYRELGFTEWGLEKKALKQNGRYYDEMWMARDLT
jgi:ribosomal protein S18 acetylase RimI-like enzyme